MIHAPNFHTAIQELTEKLLDEGKHLQPNNWQSMDVSKRKEAETIELLNQSLSVPLHSAYHQDYQSEVKPNLPWADEHFEKERVSGEPINPGETWKTWPWGLSADKFRTEGDQFSHSYAERYWPKYAGAMPGGKGKISTANSDINALHWPLHGIRYPVGDLNDVVDRLVQDPLTRQAVLSVWHPEDQHNGGQRVPCSLFYQFIQRDGRLHMVYTIRSCDALRHFRDDIYLSLRLLFWVLTKVQEKSEEWQPISVGTFTMHITSFHCFVGDRMVLQKTVK